MGNRVSHDARTRPTDPASTSTPPTNVPSIAPPPVVGLLASPSHPSASLVVHPATSRERHPHGFALPPPPVFSTSFKSVLPPINLTLVRDYRKIAFDDLDKWKFYAYMPAASFAVRTITHPLTVVKTRMQTSGVARTVYPSTASPYASSAASSAVAGESTAAAKPRIIPYKRLPVDLSNKSTFGALKHILEHEGFKGWYRGFQTAVLGLLVGPVYLTSLETTRAHLYASGIRDRLPIDVVPFLAGGAASFVSQVVGVPLDVIANRQMANSQSSGILAIARDVRRTQGLKGFYKAYWLTMLHNAPMSALVWFNFAHLHPVVSRLVPDSLAEWSIIPSATTPIRAANSEPPATAAAAAAAGASPHSQLPLAALHKWSLAELSVVFVSASMSGGLAAMLTLPLDVLRTRLQTSESAQASLRTTWTDLRRERGWKGFYSGWRPRLTSAATQSALLMTLYEVLKRVCIREGDDDQDTHKHQP